MHTRISEHKEVSSKTGNKLSVSQMSAVLTHHHLSGHNISDSDFTILTSGNSKFDLEMRESLLISKLKPILNNNISSMPLNLWYFDIPVKSNHSILTLTYCFSNSFTIRPFFLNFYRL